MSKEVLKMNGWMIDDYVPFFEIINMKIFLNKKRKVGCLLTTEYKDSHLESTVDMLNKMTGQKILYEEDSIYLGKGRGKSMLVVTIDPTSYIKLKQNKINLNLEILSDCLKEIIDHNEERYNNHFPIICNASGNTRNTLLTLSETVELDISPVFEVKE